MEHLTCFWLLALVLSVGSRNVPPPNTLDKLFDAFLEGVMDAKGGQLDPFVLEDRFLEVEKPVKLNLNFTSIQVAGLKGLRRDGPLIYTVDPAKGDKFIRVSVTASPIVVTSNLDVSMRVIYSFLPLLSTRFNVTVASFAGAIEIVTSRSDKQIRIKSFTVTELNDLEVTFFRKTFFYGPERKAWILSLVGREVIKYYKKTLLQVAEGDVENQIQSKIYTLPEQVKRLLYEWRVGGNKITPVSHKVQLIAAARVAWLEWKRNIEQKDTCPVCLVTGQGLSCFIWSVGYLRWQNHLEWASVDVAALERSDRPSDLEAFTFDRMLPLPLSLSPEATFQLLLMRLSLRNFRFHPLKLYPKTGQGLQLYYLWLAHLLFRYSHLDEMFLASEMSPSLWPSSIASSLIVSLGQSLQSQR